MGFDYTEWPKSQSTVKCALKYNLNVIAVTENGVEFADICMELVSLPYKQCLQHTHTGFKRCKPGLSR